MDQCFICKKHQSIDAGSGAIYEDERVAAFLMTAGAEEQLAYLGYVVLETKRHARGLGDLSTEEAGTVGEVMNRIGAALKNVLRAEHIYSFVQGDGVPHFHMHLVPRYSGTPDSYRHPMNILQWREAPRGGNCELEITRRKLQDALQPGCN